jgi:isochorismate synthase
VLTLTHHTTTFLQDIFAAAVQQQWAFVAFRYPNGGVPTVFLARKAAQVANLETLTDKSGFLIAPYDLTNDQSYLIKPEIVLQGDDLTVIFDKSNDFDALMANMHNKTPYHTSTQNNTPHWHTPLHITPQYHATQPEFVAMVQAAVQVMQTKKLDKVVLSRTIAHDLPDFFEPTTFFENLCHAQSNALISLCSLPNVGTWIGASPELLLEIDKNDILRTVSLAGTQARTATQTPTQWGSKEIEEQAIVSRYLLNVLSDLGVKNMPLAPPTTTQAGGLLHLKTSFETPLQHYISPKKLLNALHPTPAVCGIPKQSAFDYICANEPHQRSFYTGFWGVINQNDEYTTRLFVNLRTMQLLAHQAILYVGAGITAQSVAIDEWTETELKAQTLKSVF